MFRLLESDLDSEYSPHVQRDGSESILDRLLKKLFPEDAALVARLKSEILHSIFAHEEEVEYLSV